MEENFVCLTKQSQHSATAAGGRKGAVLQKPLRSQNVTVERINRLSLHIYV